MSVIDDIPTDDAHSFTDNDVPIHIIVADTLSCSNRAWYRLSSLTVTKSQFYFSISGVVTTTFYWVEVLHILKYVCFISDWLVKKLDKIAFKYVMHAHLLYVANFISVADEFPRITHSLNPNVCTPPWFIVLKFLSTACRMKIVCGHGDIRPLE